MQGRGRCWALLCLQSACCLWGMLHTSEYTHMRTVHATKACIWSAMLDGSQKTWRRSAETCPSHSLFDALMRSYIHIHPYIHMHKHSKHTRQVKILMAGDGRDAAIRPCTRPPKAIPQISNAAQRLTRPFVHPTGCPPLGPSFQRPRPSTSLSAAFRISLCLAHYTASESRAPMSLKSVRWRPPWPTPALPGWLCLQSPIPQPCPLYIVLQQLLLQSTGPRRLSNHSQRTRIYPWHYRECSMAGTEHGFWIPRCHFDARVFSFFTLSSSLVYSRFTISLIVCHCLPSRTIAILQSRLCLMKIMPCL